MFRALTLFIALIALHGAPVAAQIACGPYTNFAMRLDMKYGESLRSRGTLTRTIMETWVNAETGSWTLLERFADGISCVRASGENFEMLEPELPGGDT